jgi:hypothetical protein
MDKMENCLAIIGSGNKFWGIAAIPGEQIGANMVQGIRYKRGTLSLHTSSKEHQQQKFYLSFL